MMARWVYPLLVGPAALLGCAGSSDDAPPDQHEVTANWQYRWGDSPTSSTGMPLWLLDPAESQEWHDVDVPYDMPGRDGRRFVWLRAPLPKLACADRSLYLTSVLGAFEAYVGTEKVYRHGQVEEPAGIGFEAGRWHLFSVPDHKDGALLHLRVSSAGSHIGLPLLADNKALYGSEKALLSYVVANSIDRFVLGCLFVLLAVLALDYHHHRRGRGEHLYLAFGLFAASAGLAFGASAEVAQFLVSSPTLRFSIAEIGWLCFPVGLFCFCEQIAQPGERRLFRRLWQFCAAVGVVVLILQLTELIGGFVTLLLAWGLVLGVSFVVAIGLSIRGALRGGDDEGKIFYLGLIATLLFVIHDLLWSLGLIPYWHSLSAWGVLVFLVALVHIVERRNGADQRQLAEYSRRLQEYSVELEQRVADRTCDLQQKNAALEHTMEELRDAQTQLVMREKMASLGNLAAGVAHEINNPVGAIRSAADVIRRAVSHLGRAGAEGQAQSDRVQSTLESNCAVVEEASQRVARIVRTLKDFAELDEAAYQRGVDVCEALDNVLVLLESRLSQGITVDRQYEPVPLIACYAGELKQAFMNVLLNAVEALGRREDVNAARGASSDATEGASANVADAKSVAEGDDERIAAGDDKHVAGADGGYITVRVCGRGGDQSAEAGDDVVVQISDTGPGIPAADIGRIFDPGFTTKGTGVGTGLGLSTTYRTVQKHGGTITAESDGRSGTTVTISLPLVASA